MQYFYLGCLIDPLIPISFTDLFHGKEVLSSSNPLGSLEDGNCKSIALKSVALSERWLLFYEREKTFRSY